MKIKFLIVGLAMGIFLNSCTKDMLHNDIDSSSLSGDKKEQLSKRQETEKHLEKFAGILSKVTYANKEVREFLKQESLKQFDKNYDVLYFIIKDELVGENTFRDILISYSSDSEIEEIEKAVPLLNILVPEIAFFDVSAENLDVEDNEIPVAVSGEKTTSLYLNGKEEVKLEKGEIPDFHVFVVNINSRVIIPSNKNAGSNTVVFKSPNFDGSIKDVAPLKSLSLVEASIVGQKAIDAYKYFYKDDGSINQKAFQRDYIYYGITPTKQQGQLNRSVTEYIGFIEVNPRSYFKIADQKGSNSTNDDPYILRPSVTQEKRTLSEEELLDKMWTKGAYDFRFEVIQSTKQEPYIIYIAVKPNELWDFNISYSKKHKTWFRHSKHTYTIDPNNFTSKRFYLKEDKLPIGRWDLSQESINRYINIIEEDESLETEITRTYGSVRISSSKFNGDIKMSLGIGKGGNVSGGLSGEDVNSNTIKEQKTYIIRRKEKSDDLGSIHIYFYEPVIHGANGSYYDVHTYNTGHVKFGLFVK